MVSCEWRVLRGAWCRVKHTGTRLRGGVRVSGCNDHSKKQDAFVEEQMAFGGVSHHFVSHPPEKNSAGDFCCTCSALNAMVSLWVVSALMPQEAWYEAAFQPPRVGLKDQDDEVRADVSQVTSFVASRQNRLAINRKLSSVIT